MEQSAKLRELAMAFYKAMETADGETIRAYFSDADGVLAIGTDPQEWWEGHDVITQIFETQLKEMGGFTLVDGNPQAFTEGDVGWLADQVTFKASNGSDIPFRITAVYHKEDGDWKVVQWHASMGVSNEEAIGQELSTG